MSVNIHFRDIVKKYGKNVVIPGLDLEIREGEFFTLLGPSGCGKTTLLRMVAGFNSIEGGEILFNGKVINNLQPGKRNIGMVFQNYAVFPHMTVGKNVAFGLKNRGVPKDEIERRVDKVLKAVYIDNLKDRLPQNMSGGQQQRIALARAIVIEPDVLLMDEPLSNLDAKLRVEMRDVIRALQQKVGITTVYVTHDQEEAMAVSDRIAVMKDGVIQQVGTPRGIYHRPGNLFVSTFIGLSNILSGRLEAKAGQAVLHMNGYAMPVAGLREGAAQGDMPVKVSVRPEDFVVSESADGIQGSIASSVFLGNSTHYTVALNSGETVMVMEESSEKDSLRVNDRVSLRIKANKLNLYDESGERSLMKGASE